MSRPTREVSGKARTFGNGVAVSYGYDPQVYRLTAQTATLGRQSLQSIAYVYDPVGNVVQSTDAAQEGAGALVHGVTVPAARRYRYDAHYRLLSATGRVHQALLQHDYVPGVTDTLKGTRHISLNNGQAVERFTRTYTYDKSGNLTAIKHAGTSQSWTTQMWVSPTSNRSTPALAANGVPVTDPESYFDVAGNQVVLAHLRSIGWDWHGRLSRAVTVSRPGGTDDGESYVYGADSLRARKVATRVVSAGIVETTEYVWLGDAERKRISRNGTVFLERWSIGIGDGEERIAFVDRWIVDSLKREVDVPQTRTRYQLSVTSASVGIELDDSGALLSYEEYFPYGGTAFVAGDNLRAISAKDYRWAGKMADDATGLYCFGYRYFVPWTGRWLSCDPLGSRDDVNLYQFALGNPIGNRDVDGLQTEKEKPPVVYTERPYVKPADESEAAKVAAMRASLPADFQALFDSLSASDQVRMVTGPSGSVAMVPKDLDNLGAGARVISVQEFRRTYLPALARWSKAHHLQAIVQVPPSAEASADDGGLGEQSDSNEGDGDDPGKSQDKGDGGGGKKIDAPGDGSGAKNPTAPGDGQKGPGGGEGTGTDPSSEKGSTTGTDGTGPGGVKLTGVGGKIPGGQGCRRRGREEHRQSRERQRSRHRLGQHQQAQRQRERQRVRSRRRWQRRGDHRRRSLRDGYLAPGARQSDLRRLGRERQRQGREADRRHPPRLGRYQQHRQPRSNRPATRVLESARRRRGLGHEPRLAEERRRHRDGRLWFAPQPGRHAARQGRRVGQRSAEGVARPRRARWRQC